MLAMLEPTAANVSLVAGVLLGAASTDNQGRNEYQQRLCELEDVAGYGSILVVC